MTRKEVAVAAVASRLAVVTWSLLADLLLPDHQSEDAKRFDLLPLNVDPSTSCAGAPASCTAQQQHYNLHQRPWPLSYWPDQYEGS